MIDALNIATMPIADKVHRHMLASYYALQLDALQAEAKRLGYFFAQADTAATMPPVLADCLARAVMYRRECYLNPDAPDIWESRTDTAMRDGYAPETLQEGQQACVLLAAEECRQREKASLPPEPSPLSEVEVSSFVDEFFTKLDAATEEVPT